MPSNSADASGSRNPHISADALLIFTPPFTITSQACGPLGFNSLHDGMPLPNANINSHDGNESFSSEWSSSSAPNPLDITTTRRSYYPESI